MVNAVVSSSGRFPTTAEIREAMVTAGTSIGGSEYLVERIQAQAEASKFMGKHTELRDNVVGAVEKFAQYVAYKLNSSAQPWSGQAPETSSFKNMHKNIADAATEKLDVRLADVTIYYNVSADGKYERAYRSSTGNIDKEAAAALDNQFGSWLAAKDEHGYKIKGGYIYKSDTQTYNENERISADQIKEWLADGTLEKHLEKAITDKATVERYVPQAAQQATAKQSTAPTAEQATSKTTESEVEPEGPQQGSSFSG